MDCRRAKSVESLPGSKEYLAKQVVRCFVCKVSRSPGTDWDSNPEARPPRA